MLFDVLVIAMPRELERRRQVTTSLAAAGIEDFTFLDATDGGDPDQLQRVTGYDDKRALEVTGRSLTPTEIACFDSHRRSWEWIVKRRRPVLVLESDAEVTADVFEVSERLCRERGRSLPDWEHVMHYYHECLPSWHDRHQINSDYRLVRFANSRVYVTSTMLLMPAAAKKLLAKGQEISLPVDNYMTGGKIDKGVNLFAVYPPPAKLSWTSNLSNIEAERCQYQRKRKKQRSLRHWSVGLRKLWRQVRPYPRWL